MNNLLRNSAFLFIMIVSSLVSHAQDITGTWKGVLQVQANEFPLVFHIGKDAGGKWIASFDSPSQNGFGLPVSEVISKADSVIFMMAMINGKYAGVLSQDKKTIDGTWFQANASFPLTVNRNSDTARVKQQLRR